METISDTKKGGPQMILFDKAVDFLLGMEPIEYVYVALIVAFCVWVWKTK